MKRRAIQAIVFLLLGAIVNVAVAWGLAYSTDFTSFGKIGTRDGTAFVWPEYLQQLSWPSPTTMEDCRIPGMDFGVTLFEVSGGDSDAGWQRTDSPAKVHVSLLVYQFGLPLCGLQLETHGVRAGPRGMEMVRAAHAASGWRAGIDMSAARQGGATFLPATPIWPGFAINTIFYAAVLWAMFVMPFALRRRLRIRRGLCPACAYPIGSSPVCTECGANLPLSLGEGRGEGA